MKISKKTSLEQLAAIITNALSENDISCVLVGGSVVSIYTENKYQSKDLDFISSGDNREIKKVMHALGFTNIGKDFHHSECNFSVEFPSGPLGIGDRVPIKAEGQRIVAGTKISLFSPTQCVMDRLAWFYHSRDRQCLEQAVAVALAQPINLAKIKKWSEEERASEKFKIFLEHLKIAKKPN